MEYGLQMYSVRDFTEKDLLGTLKKVAEMTSPLPSSITTPSATRTSSSRGLTPAQRKS